jgi:hypothetical protein
MSARRAVSGVAIVLVAAIGACDGTGGRPRGLRQATMSYHFTITQTQAPPHAEDSIRYSIVVLDKKTGQPVQAGEGQIWAGHPQGPRTWDGLTYGPEVGTYHGWLVYTIPGTWSVNVRFRRDSLQPLEATNWMQDVIDAKPYTKSGGQ